MTTAGTGKLTIDCARLRENTRILKSILKSGHLGATVKADSYGIGMAQAAPQFWAEGVRDYFVATPGEGIELRKILKNAVIYVLNGFCRGGEDAYREFSLIPVLGSLEAIERYRNFAGPGAPAVLHFDTGMNRLGFSKVETRLIMEDKIHVKDLDLKLIMSHFVSADDPHSNFADKQYTDFITIADHFPGVPRSMAASAGIFRDDRYHFDLVRPGMALYGLNPLSNQENPMKPVLTLSVPVLQTRMADQGETAGYFATYRFDKQTPLATVSLGYADGFLWGMGNKVNLYWNGQACPVRGRVSMDLVAVDLSAIAENERPREGDMMEVIGPHQSADTLAKAAGTIGYEILTSLGNRYERIYINQS